MQFAKGIGIAALALALSTTGLGNSGLATFKSAHAGPAQELGKAYDAFEAGDFAEALKRAKRVKAKALLNEDYRLYVIAQSRYVEGELTAALADFEALAKLRGSRFADLAQWRVADSLWRLGRHAEASQRYGKLLRQKPRDGEWAIARFRIAKAAEEAAVDEAGKQVAIAAYKDFLREHPGHRLSEEADERLVALGDGGKAALSATDRIQRGADLIEDKKWEMALQELAELDREQMDADTQREHTFWLSMSLFKRRRHYEKAGRNFLSIYKDMGKRADEALFHGARALSRADFDTEAIKWYQVLVKEYPRSKWAAEAQFLSGWLEFNRGNYKEALPYLAEMKTRFRRSEFTDEAPWYRGMSYFLLKDYKAALPFFEEVEKQGGKEIGGKGRYWRARALQELGKNDEAYAIYRGLVDDYPFSWYALLGTTHLRKAGIELGPFGTMPVRAEDAPDIDKKLDPKIKRDPLILKGEELIRAGLFAAAGHELRDGERAYFRRHRKNKAGAMAVLLDSYRRAENFNRPWMLAVVHGGRALNGPAEGKARIWWEHAYPLAYRELVEKYRELSGFPDYYLYTIMRKESGFDPHTHSYADAQGLLQMIPPTTERVVPHLGIEYTEDLLFDPERNIQAGAWYIGRLLKKFGGQIPIGAGSYNSGPRAVMRWLKRNGDHPIDEFVELLSYRQTRNYMKRTTETYARYKYLYDGEIYQQPLELNADFIVNDIDY